MANSRSWRKICDDYKILEHNYNKKPFVLTAEQIKKSCRNFEKTTEKEVRILCKQDSREERPDVFVKNGLFLLPVKNGVYNIIQGEGYVNIPPIETEEITYESQLKFILDSSKVGNSEMQHLDYAYASSLIRTFMDDQSLVLTIRGRKYTPKFTFKVRSQKINVESVQTEVDAGYEGKNQIVLIEAKSFSLSNVIIRQLFYPYRQWGEVSKKEIITLFFERNSDASYSIWQFKFLDPNDYNSIEFVRSGKFTIKGY